MIIEVKEHVRRGLKNLETIDLETRVIFSLSEISEAYPAHEIHDVSFFSWGDCIVFIRRKEAH